jgi:hypothetical protein
MSTNYDFIKIGALVCPKEGEEIVYVTDIIGDTIVTEDFGTGVGSYKKEELQSLESLELEVELANGIRVLKESGHRIFRPK